MRSYIIYALSGAVSGILIAETVKIFQTPLGATIIFFCIISSIVTHHIVYGKKKSG